MLKAALGVLVSVFALGVLVPSAHSAEATTGAARQNRIKAQGSQATKPRGSAKRKKVARKVAAQPSNDRKLAQSNRRRAGMQKVAFSPSAQGARSTAGDLAGLHLTRDPLDLKSNVAYVMDQSTAEVLFEKNGSATLPIASITKLMTALVVMEANQNLDEVLTVTEADIDREKFSHSRLRVGSQLTRADMLHIALMSSENRAASALGRHYPGGISAFVAAMNGKAQQLGMTNARFVDSTGLSSANVASARDLARLVVAAHQYPVLRQYSTDPKYTVEPGGYALHYKNSNHLVDNTDWEIGLQKTGFISEAGRCLVMQARIEGRPVVMVFLDSKGKLSRTADAGRVRKWIENARPFNRVVAQQS